MTTTTPPTAAERTKIDSAYLAGTIGDELAHSSDSFDADAEPLEAWMDATSVANWMPQLSGTPWLY